MSGRRVIARTAAPLLASVAAIALVAGCSSNHDEKPEIGKVTRGDVTEVVEAPATVIARGAATVSSPAAGTVDRVYVKDGEHVGRGEIVMRIESPSARSALAEAQQADSQVASSGSGTIGGGNSAATSAAVERADKAAKSAFAQAAAANKAITVPSARRAADAQLAASKAQYAATRSAVTRATAQVGAGLGSAASTLNSLTRAQRLQTQAAVTAAQRTVEALTVRAPIAGVVGLGAGASSGSGSSGSSDLSSIVGQLPASQQALASSVLGGSGGTSSTGEIARGVPVSSGQALLTVTDVSALSLTAQVDETDVLLVKPGVAADIELAAVPGATYTGTVKSVGLAPTTSARGGVTYGVRIALGAGKLADGRAAPRARPGMSAVASLRVRTARDAVVVPVAAVFQEGARSAVWLVRNGVANRREVRLGAQGETSYQIRGGLAVGDVVVVRGADRVREGQRVG